MNKSYMVRVLRKSELADRTSCLGLVALRPLIFQSGPSTGINQTLSALSQASRRWRPPCWHNQPAFMKGLVCVGLRTRSAPILSQITKPLVLSSQADRLPCPPSNDQLALTEGRLWGNQVAGLFSHLWPPSTQVSQIARVSQITEGQHLGRWSHPVTRASVPISRLQPHFPGSMGARSSLPCARPDSNIKFCHRQVIQQMDKEVDECPWGRAALCWLWHSAAPWSWAGHRKPQLPSLHNEAC